MLELEKLVQRKRRALQEKKWPAYDVAAMALGNFYADAHQYQQALDVFAEATTVFRGKEAFRMSLGRAHRMVAEMQILLENFDEAVLHVDKFLRIAQQEDNSVEEQRAYATIGRVHLLHGQSQTDVTESKKALRKAETAFLRSLQVCKRLPDNIGRVERIDMEARLHLNLGVTKEYLGDLDDTEKHMQKALALCRDHNLNELLHQCYVTTASFVHSKRDDITKALRLLNLALGVAERLGTRKKCETLLNKADIFIKSGDFQSARQTLHRAYRLRTAVKHDQTAIEQMLRTVAAMCRAEDQLVTTASTDYATKKALFELLGDGSCQLKNFAKALESYQLMLTNAEKCFVSERELVPIYVSLYQTLLDLGRNEDALVYMWKEFHLVKDAPKEAMATLLTIADSLDACKRDFWTIDEVLQNARVECKQLDDPRTEAAIVRKMITLREKHRMMTLVEMLRDEAAAAGLDLTAAVDDDGTESSVSTEKNTLELGNDINLDELTGSDNSDDDSSTSQKAAKAIPPTASTSGVAHRSRRGQSVAVKRNEKGETGLHQACISGNVAQVRRLLDQKHPVNVRDFAGWMPLHEAANHGHVEIVRLLIERGASINDKGGKMCDGVTALHDACGNGCLDVVELLLEAGANATMRTDLRETPLDTLEKWRARQKLDPVEQNLYDTVHARLLRQIERSGMRRLNVTPQKKSALPSPAKRRPLVSHCSSDEEMPRASATTIDGILQDEFATQFCYDDEDDNEENSSSSNERTRTENVSEYKSIMDTLRSGGSNVAIPRESPIKRRLSANDSNGPKRRAGMLDTQEVGENWLDQDVIAVRKKPKMLSLTLGRDSRPDRSTPVKRPYQSKENTHPNRSSPAAAAVPLNIGGALSDDDSCSVDAFDMMMNAVGKVSSSVRRRLSSSKASSSAHRQQSSLLSSGFVRFRSEHNLQSSSDNDEHLVSSTLLDTDCSIVMPVPIVAAPIIPVGSTFKVRVKEQLLNVPVSNEVIGDLTIGWLAEESARRYYNLKGVQPVLEITSNDGAVYESTDPLAVVLGQTVETNVLEWILPSIAHRYQESCRQMQMKPNNNIRSILELIQSTHSLSLADQMLRPDISKPLFKAIHHQANIESIDLSHNFLEDDSCRFLADGLATLTKLKSLKLSGNCITHHGLATLVQKLTATSCTSLASLDLLDLSHNPLGNDGIAQLARLTEHCPALRSLNLCAIDATHLSMLKTSAVTALDLSHNQFPTMELRQLLRSLNACKVATLKLGFCVGTGGGAPATRALAEWLQSGTLVALKELNLNGWDLDDGDVFELVQTLRRANSIDALYLMENPQIETIGFVQLVQSVRVDRLYMDGCSAIGRHLANTLEQLDGNSTSNCRWIRLSKDGRPDCVDMWRRFWTRMHGSAGNVDTLRNQVVLKLCD